MKKFSERFLGTLFAQPWIIVALIAGVTVFFASWLPKVTLDNNNIRFVPAGDEARLTSQYIDDTFGSSLFVLVGLERKYGSVFDGEFLTLIRDYTRRIEEIEITGSINSIISSDYIYGQGDSIIVEKLVADDFSGTPGEIDELKKRLLSWDLYHRSLISDDFNATQILVPLEIDAEDAGRPEVIDHFIQIRDIAREMFAGKAEVYVTGLPVISAEINEAVRADLILLIPLVVLVVLVILFFSFRQFSAVILPLLTVGIAVIWCVGAMPLFGVKLSVISTILPVILVAVGSAYGIHVVTHYIGDRSVKPELSREEHRELIIALTAKIGKPVFLAALTTLAGFSSFCFTPVLPIREFGFFSGFGVLVSYITAVTLIPALLLIRGPRPPGTKLPKTKIRWDIAAAFLPLVRRKALVIALAALIAGVSFYGVSKIQIDNVFVEYFRSTTDISRSDKFIREQFGGSKIVSVVARAETPEILLSPESLKAMDGLTMYLETKVPETGKTLGFTHLIKRINQVFNASESPDGIKAAESNAAGPNFQNPSDLDPPDFGFGEFGFGDFGFEDTPVYEAPPLDAGPGFVGESAGDSPPLTTDELFALLEKAASSGGRRTMDAAELIREMERLVNYQGASYYEIPSIPERYGKKTSRELGQLVSNYLLLLSGSVSAYANDPLEPTAIKTTIQLRTVGEKDTDRAMREIYDYIEANFPKNLETLVGGSALVEASLNRLVVQSQVTSVFISIVVVFLILAVFNRSLSAGLIGVAPLSLSILINFAVMGFLGIKLNLGTSMVAGVSVGIGIDYTIHYMEAFKREFRASGFSGDFLAKAYATSGKAILINAVSVGAGFAVLLFSRFIMLGNLGLLIALTMGTSALSSLTIIPVLLLIFKPQFIYKE